MTRALWFLIFWCLSSISEPKYGNSELWRVLSVMPNWFNDCIMMVTVSFTCTFQVKRQNISFRGWSLYWNHDIIILIESWSDKFYSIISTDFIYNAFARAKYDMRTNLWCCITGSEHLFYDMKSNFVLSYLYLNHVSAWWYIFLSAWEHTKIELKNHDSSRASKLPY